MTEHTPWGGHAGGFPGGRRERGQSCQDEGGRLKQNWHIKEAKPCRKEKSSQDNTFNCTACFCINERQHDQKTAISD